MNSLIEITRTVLLRPARLLAQVEYSYSSSAHGQAPGPMFWVFSLAFAILMIAALWKIFSKAGQPGWAAIIPIVNTYFTIKVAGRPWWWLILMLVPFVDFIVWIILCIDLAKSFGKGAGFGIGLLLLPIISSRFWVSAVRNIKGRQLDRSAPEQRFRDRRNLCKGKQSRRWNVLSPILTRGSAANRLWAIGCTVGDSVVAGIGDAASGTQLSRLQPGGGLTSSSSACVFR